MKRIVLSAGFLCIVFYMLIFPESTYAAALDALLICAKALLPTLFVFMVCSNFFVLSGFGKIIKKPFEVVMQPFFGISGAGALAVALGLISGYPVGAVCVCGLYEKNDITKNEAERLLGFTNNSGPLFIIGSVGTVMLQNKNYGYFLCAVHIVSAVISGMVLRAFREKKSGKEKISSSESISLSDAVTESVKNALSGILTVCAYTVLFSIIISMWMFVAGKSPVSLFLSGMIEMSNAIQKLTAAGENIKNLLPQISFLLGFGGMCVHLQVMNVTKKHKLNLKYYFTGKCLHAIFSVIISFALTRVIM